MIESIPLVRLLSLQRRPAGIRSAGRPRHSATGGAQLRSYAAPGDVGAGGHVSPGEPPEAQGDEGVQRGEAAPGEPEGQA